LCVTLTPTQQTRCTNRRIKMTKITREYENSVNGGKERVTRDGDKFTINSYINARLGWMGERVVTRDEIQNCMVYTNAPDHVVTAIFG